MNLDQIPAYAPRTFVPEEAHMDDKDAIIKLFNALLEREVASIEELDALMADYSELLSAIWQCAALLRVELSCQTDDPARAEAYEDFVRTIEPELEPLTFKFDQRYMQLRKEFPDTDGIYVVFDRATQADIDIFREENVPLQTENKLDAQEYQAVTGKMTVDFEGAERTMPEMAKYVLEPDRDLRERSWRATLDRRFADRETVDGIYGRLIKRRHEMARNADFKNYVDYTFQAKHRFHYTPEDCLAFHDAIERCFLPLVEKMQRARAASLKLDPLRPWDLDADPDRLPPLAPFSTGSELNDGCSTAFHTVDPELGAMYDQIGELGLLDLESRKGKAPGGYQAMFSEVRKPFIFMNAVGTDNDVRTLLHEGGHAFHSLLCADQPTLFYRHAPIEFCEVASFGMEYLAGNDLSVFYSSDDRKRATRTFLESRVAVMPWIATIDAFQHWIYLHPEHSHEERREAWLSIFRRFRGKEVDWIGLDEEERNSWQRQIHLFTHPMYYVEYGIAQIGALQLWLQAKEDPKRALTNYKKALALGGSRPLPELFEAAGLRFDFSEAFIAPLVDALDEALFSG